MAKFNIKNRRYLGSKSKLIDFIKEVVNKECGDFNSFLDLFSGTGNVGWSFNNEDTSIYLNDILKSNYYSYVAWFGNELIDEHKISKIINDYNGLIIEESNYFSDNFSDTFFSESNCKKIGYIRENIECLFNQKEINFREKCIIITSLIYAMDRIANTVGHYDAYRLKGDLDKELILEELEVASSKVNKNNKIFNEDANELVKHIKCDVVYIDPPYNSRQYCDAYHLLENVACWEKPEVYGVARKMDRSKLKSKYCTNSAPLVFSDLIDNIEAKYILVSYNNMGTKGAGRSQAKVSDEDILKALSKKGEVKIFETDFNQFNAGKTNISNHKERLFLCKVGHKTKFCSDIVIEKFVKSPLNYTGGKFKLLEQIFDKFPNNFDTFIDLFGGGFNVGVNVKCETVVYNDIQNSVVRIIKLFYDKDYETIINKIEKIIEKYNLSDSYKNGYSIYSCDSASGLGKYNKDKYYSLRKDYNEMKTNSESRDIMFLVLIIFGFNNQIRFNSNGEFNMPVGKRDFNSSVRKNIKEFAIKIKNNHLIVLNKNFSSINFNDYKNPFFYCDPPYLLGTASYNENNGWTQKDEIELLSFLKQLDDNNIKFALSNVIEHKGMTHDVLKQWIEDNHFNLIYIKSDYNNSNYHIKNKKEVTREILVTNY